MYIETTKRRVIIFLKELILQLLVVGWFLGRKYTDNELQFFMTYPISQLMSNHSHLSVCLIILLLSGHLLFILPESTHPISLN